MGLAVLPRAAAQVYAQALGLAVVSLHGLEAERRLLVAMRRRDQLSAEALALVSMIEAETQAARVPVPGDADVRSEAVSTRPVPRP